MNIILPIIAVILGFIVAYFIKASSTAIKLLLSFSGAFLLSITVFEFLPEVYLNYNKSIGLLIMGGILLQIFLEFLSKGAEHGHLHLNESRTNFPFALFISLCIHSLLEGSPIQHNEHLLIGVVIHKIPIAIIISSFLLNSKLSKTKIGIFLLLFALMTPLGSFLQENFVALQAIEKYINAVVIGIFLHISTTILFESSKNHQFNLSKIVVIIFGVFIAYLL
ncbi:ZIP family metal transporter [Mesonia aestuariivivens]|uniref:ZIP family metal transporter n=1 Tax=Mesonia aestuariivivens TaxID=2796128 RepID=A0ABS6W0F9_9FLAO|nr:ZIP family metal transporter [Mesonia aestuariivivens]MBW2961343.1 ZIP family metal transporter [Mesonia aestuariivivens]